MEQKIFVIDQKGLNIYEKGQKKEEFLDLKYLLLVEFSSPESGVPPTTH